jgi:predicted metal-dependent phosphoesterase TrpH
MRRLVFLAIVLVFSGTGLGAVRSEIKIPDISGYVVVKCDFHNHTVFSDGGVWPTVRAEEAWREGLDAIALTDHLEHHPHEQDIRINPNRPYEIAKPKADSLGLTIIRGAEITRDMPPGHFNALFLKDANALAVKDWRDAIKAAVDQDAFIFWNHPGWVGQQPDGKSIWYEEHTQLMRKAG